MRNFFSLTSPISDSAKFAKFKMLPIIIFIFTFTMFSGCSVVLRMDSPKPVPVPKISLKERLDNAEAVKASLLKQLANPKTVDETIRIKEELDNIQDKIESLKAGMEVKPVDKDKMEGFKSVKQKETIYGPIGITVELTKWVLEKLWIIHET